MSPDQISQQMIDLLRRITSGKDEEIRSALIEAEELLAKLSKEDKPSQDAIQSKGACL